MGQNGRRNKRRKQTHMPLTIVRWVLSLLLLCLIVLTFGYLDKRLNDGRIINKIIHSGQEVQVVKTTETEATETVEPDVLTVCIDAGHGGKDNGSESDSRKEKDDTLKMAELLKKTMEAKGIKVVMTRETDVKVTLKERVATANSSGADYFISIHRNKGDGYGVETWINENPSEVESMLGQQIHDNIINVGVQRDRGLKQGTEGGSSGYYVVRATSMPACLIELGFINNTKDNELFDTKMSAYADAITKAVTDTYAKYGKQKDQNNVTGTTEAPAEADTQSTTEASQTTEAAKTTEAAGGTANATGMVLTNTQIPDVSALSGETLNWGQGTNYDSLNRPGGCLGYNQKYGKYSADFIQDTTDKVIYLSFDEGYEYGFTPSIINTLKEKQVPAVFFVTKPYAVKDPDLVKSIIDNGFILGNHSVTHPADGLPSETLDQQKEEIMGNHQYIKDNFGYDMCLFRFPAGKFSEQSLAIVNNCNYRSVFWSFAYMDYDVNNQPDEAASLQKLVDRLHPGAIYLLHAESKTNTDILGQFIDKVREAGYTFGYYYDTIKKN